jgi:hypothetical protein
VKLALIVAVSVVAGCTTDRSSPAASMEEGGSRIVHIAWTNSHEPADAATCYAHPDLTVRFRVVPIGGETVSYAPVPCAEGLFTVEVPVRFVIAEVATIESSSGAPIDASGHATVDLLDWER